MQTVSPDQVALRILMSDRSAEQKRVAFGKLERLVRIAEGEECPECGSRDTEWNGHNGRDAGYRCVCCDHRFGPDYE